MKIHILQRLISAHYSGVNQDTCRNDTDLFMDTVKQCHVRPGFGLLCNNLSFVFNRPGVTGAVIQSPPSLINSFIHSLYWVLVGCSQIVRRKQNKNRKSSIRYAFW